MQQRCPLLSQLQEKEEKTVIPDELKQHAVELHNIVSLLYLGYPPDNARHAYVSMKQVKRLIWLERKLQVYMTGELREF